MNWKRSTLLYAISILLHSSRLRLRHFSIFCSRFSCTFIVAEWIYFDLLSTRSVLNVALISLFRLFAQFVHSSCIYTLLLCLLISTFCSKQNATSKKGANTDSIRFMYVYGIVCTNKSYYVNRKSPTSYIYIESRKRNISFSLYQCTFSCLHICNFECVIQ